MYRLASRVAVWSAVLGVAACTNPNRESAIRPDGTTAATVLPATPNLLVVTLTDQASPENPAAGVAAAPVPRRPENDVFELPPVQVRGEFQMSFGFGVKIIKDQLSTRVLVMYIDSVDPDSDAGKKGLEVGARIMAIDGRPVTEFDATFSQGGDLNRIFSARNRNDKVMLKVLPPGTGAARTLTIVERPFRFDAPAGGLINQSR